MAWTYIPPGTGGSTDKDKVRLLIGDTDPNLPLLSDEEIQFFLTMTGEPAGENGAYSPGQIYLAGAYAADAAAASAWSLVDKTIGPTHVSLSQRRQALMDLADRLWAQVGGRTPMAAFDAKCGGISIADKETQREDTDAVQPSFTRDMQESRQIGGGGLTPSDVPLSPR